MSVEERVSMIQNVLKKRKDLITREKNRERKIKRDLTLEKEFLSRNDTSKELGSETLHQRSELIAKMKESTHPPNLPRLKSAQPRNQKSLANGGAATTRIPELTNLSKNATKRTLRSAKRLTKMGSLGGGGTLALVAQNTSDAKRAKSSYKDLMRYKSQPKIGPRASKPRPMTSKVGSRAKRTKNKRSFTNVANIELIKKPKMTRVQSGIGFGNRNQTRIRDFEANLEKLVDADLEEIRNKETDDENNWESWLGLTEQAEETVDQIRMKLGRIGGKPCCGGGNLRSEERLEGYEIGLRKEADRPLVDKLTMKEGKFFGKKASKKRLRSGGNRLKKRFK